jgi:uncharacterized protein YndB with AHSA1/START domain
MEPVRYEVVVEAPQEKAFRVFTEGMNNWWSRTHKIGKGALKTAVLEPRVNGRWYEIDDDGSQCEWGKVLVWEPPRRLVLAWQINGQWQFDPELVTEVEVVFRAEGPGRTRVELEHRNLDRFGAAAEAIRKAFSAPDGWPGLLGNFGKSRGLSRRERRCANAAWRCQGYCENRSERFG